MKLIDNVLESDSCVLHLLLSPIYFAVRIVWSLLSWVVLRFVMIFSICTGSFLKAARAVIHMTFILNLGVRIFSYGE